MEHGVGWQSFRSPGGILHPITAASFEAIDREIGAHEFPAAEYAIVRRAIHSSADFELKDLFRFGDGSIQSGLAALRDGCPVIVDVRMVAVAVERQLQQIGCPLHCAIASAPCEAPVGQTRTEAGMRTLALAHPNSIFVVGNAPTSLLALAQLCDRGEISPALVVGVPVGFVAVERSKEALAALDVPQIRVTGRKGGSPIAAAIVNALVNLALESQC